MKTWAVGLNKGWVEIRTSVEALKPLKSKVIRHVEIPKAAYNEETGLYGGKRDLVLQVVCWEGGKVVCCVPRAKFLALARNAGSEAPKTGAVVQLPAAMATNFESAKWMKAQGIDA